MFQTEGPELFGYNTEKKKKSWEYSNKVGEDVQD